MFDNLPEVEFEEGRCANAVGDVARGEVYQSRVRQNRKRQAKKVDKKLKKMVRT
jgi:hypothetical protein